MKIGHCIQIGIDRDAEYIFLTGSDWKVKLYNADQEWQLDPNIFSDISSWHFYGVDANPHSIACAAVKYRPLESENIVWCCACIDPAKEAFFVGDFGFNQPICVPPITLDRLFESLALVDCDLLALDIEGGEYRIFEDYDWQIKPRVIKIEMHHQPHERLEKDGLMILLEEQGYHLIDLMETDLHAYTKFLRQA